MSGQIVTCMDACWAAVNNWTPLAASFQRKFQSNVELEYLSFRGVGPSDIGEKAAICIKEQPFNVIGVETMSLSFPIAMKIEIWKRADKYRDTVDLLEQVLVSLYAARPGPGLPTYLVSATCGPPQQIIGVSVVITPIPQGENANSTFDVVYASAVAVFITKIPIPTS